MPSNTSLQTGHVRGRVATLINPVRNASSVRKPGCEHKGHAKSRAHMFLINSLFTVYIFHVNYSNAASYCSPPSEHKAR